MMYEYAVAFVVGIDLSNVWSKPSKRPLRNDGAPQTDRIFALVQWAGNDFQRIGGSIPDCPQDRKHRSGKRIGCSGLDLSANGACTLDVAWVTEFGAVCLLAARTTLGVLRDRLRSFSASAMQLEGISVATQLGAAGSPLRSRTGQGPAGFYERAHHPRSALGTRCGSAYCCRTRITGENANGYADD